MVSRCAGQPSPRLRIWISLACLLPVALSCESDLPASRGAESHHQSMGPLVHNAFGVPGPWWRRDGTPQSFDNDLIGCRRESTEARTRPGEPDPRDTAYRAFLGCMGANGWKRGIPPRPEAQ